MKKLTTILISLCFLAFVTQSCGIAGGIDPVPDGKFSATIDGKSWKAKEVTAITLFGTFSMTATNGDQSFNIAFLGSEVEEGKTYSFDGIENTNIFSQITYVASEDKSYIYKKGTLKITKFKDNQVAEGEFDLTMVDGEGNEISVENGEFKAEIFL